MVIQKHALLEHLRACTCMQTVEEVSLRAWDVPSMSCFWANKKIRKVCNWDWQGLLIISRVSVIHDSHYNYYNFQSAKNSDIIFFLQEKKCWDFSGDVIYIYLYVEALKTGSQMMGKMAAINLHWQWWNRTVYFQDTIMMIWSLIRVNIFNLMRKNYHQVAATIISWPNP